MKVSNGLRRWVLIAFVAALLMLSLVVMNTHIVKANDPSVEPIWPAASSLPWTPPTGYYKSETPVYAVSTGIDPAVATLLGIIVGGGIAIIAFAVAGRRTTPTV